MAHINVINWSNHKRVQSLKTYSLESDFLREGIKNIELNIFDCETNYNTIIFSFWCSYCGLTKKYFFQADKIDNSVIIETAKKFKVWCIAEREKC